MSDCSDPVTCPNGECIGCAGGEVWCQDPRCSPNCPGSSCMYSQEHDDIGNLVVIVILICLLAILFIVWFVYGPQLFEPHNDHERANVIVPQEYGTGQSTQSIQISQITQPTQVSQPV